MMCGVAMTSMTSSMFMLLSLLTVRGVLMMHFFWLMFRMLSVIHIHH
jgi:hypothetical protein